MIDPDDTCRAVARILENGGEPWDSGTIESVAEVMTAGDWLRTNDEGMVYAIEPPEDELLAGVLLQAAEILEDIAEAGSLPAVRSLRRAARALHDV